MYSAATSSAARFDAKKTSSRPRPSQSGRPTPCAAKTCSGLPLVEPGGRHRSGELLERPRLVPRVRGEREDRLGVDGHPRLRARAGVGGEQLVVVEDDPVVDPDDRSVPDRVVVGRDRRMALRVVAHVDENLGRVRWHRDPLEQTARGRALLRDDRIPVGGAAMGIPDCVRAAVGDPRKERLRRERAVDAAPLREAISGDSAHHVLAKPFSISASVPFHRRPSRLGLSKADLGWRRYSCDGVFVCG